MKLEGPILETLTRRLAETPEEFLAEPRIGSTGRVHVAAVAGDLLSGLGSSVAANDLVSFAGRDSRIERNRLSFVLLLCWLLADEWFRQNNLSGEAILDLLSHGYAEFGEQVAAYKLVSDPDRREELARFTIARLGYRPRGETTAQAQDRLTSLSSAERTRVLRASRAAEQRARSIREALVRKAAEESADKFTRE